MSRRTKTKMADIPEDKVNEESNEQPVACASASANSPPSSRPVRKTRVNALAKNQDEETNTKKRTKRSNSKVCSEDVPAEKLMKKTSSAAELRTIQKNPQQSKLSSSSGEKTDLIKAKKSEKIIPKKKSTSPEKMDSVKAAKIPKEKAKDQVPPPLPSSPPPPPPPIPQKTAEKAPEPVVLIEDDADSIETKADSIETKAESNNTPRAKKSNNTPKAKKSHNTNTNKILGMTIPILVLEPKKPLTDEQSNLKSVENIRANYVIDQVGKSLFSTVKSQSIKPTSTPNERRRPLKNTFKDVSMIGTPGGRSSKENKDDNH
jgi:hypothetical protein